jgi:acetyl-CoA carboxylase carboxyl transferase subunit alpha
VISPEGAASILYRSADRAKDAATAMKITAQDLLGFGVIDGIIPEPLGGAHRGRANAIKSVGDSIEKALYQLEALDAEGLRAHRADRFYRIGRSLVDLPSATDTPTKAG